MNIKQSLRRFREFFGEGAERGGEKQRRERAARQSREGRANDAPFRGKRVFYYFLFALLFLALYLAYVLLRPFLHALILAVMFSALSYPLYRRIVPCVRGKEYLASGLTIVLLVTLAGVPIVYFISQLIPQAASSIDSLTRWLASDQPDLIMQDKIMPLLKWLDATAMTWADISVEEAKKSLLNLSGQAGQIMFSWGTGLIVDSIALFGQFLLMLLMMFFFLKDGESMLHTLKRLSPLREEQEDRIFLNLRRMAKSVLVGGFAIALIQGCIGGVGLAIVGIKPLFWGTVMCVAALVPVFGTGLVWVPAALYLLLTGQTWQALFLLAWCGLLVNSIDSIFRPLFMRGASTSSSSLLYLFLAIMGGIKAFGMLGIVYGPMILAFVMIMLTIYYDEYSNGALPALPKRRRAARTPGKAQGRRRGTRDAA